MKIGNLVSDIDHDNKIGIVTFCYQTEDSIVVWWTNNSEEIDLDWLKSPGQLICKL